MERPGSLSRNACLGPRRGTSLCRSHDGSAHEAIGRVARRVQWPLGRMFLYRRRDECGEGRRAGFLCRLGAAMLRGRDHQHHPRYECEVVGSCDGGSGAGRHRKQDGGLNGSWSAESGWSWRRHWNRHGRGGHRLPPSRRPQNSVQRHSHRDRGHDRPVGPPMRSDWIDARRTMEVAADEIEGRLRRPCLLDL